jgi:threonine dehydrogenase-like Zn-dependent dehydrogenase
MCGSDLHLYDPLWPVVRRGGILGHEAVGIVEEVGPDVTHIAPGDRDVVPFNIACGDCPSCDTGFSQ